MARDRPTALQSWRDIMRTPVEELAAAAKVSRDTVQVALRGEPIGKRAAAALSRVTKIPAAVLRAGRIGGV